MVLFEKLRVLRKRTGLSQMELAEKLKVSRQAISNWEAGTARPSIDNIHYLSKLYNIPLEILLDDDAGVITSDGLFHPLKAFGGSFDQYIRVDQHGNYVLAIRNNSNVEVAVSGIVSY